MAQHALEPGTRNRSLVLSAILRQPQISRTDIAEQLGLNIASISRISRELIDAGLVHEVEHQGVSTRPGRRFVGLCAHGDGGFIVGICLNAFRQSVTLANLENKKIDEWVSPEPPGGDDETFLRLCMSKAKAMINAHVTDRKRFFGVGVAVAANLDIGAGVILDANTFGWTRPIALRKITHEILDAPLVLETPSCAINQSEAEFGNSQSFKQVSTLHCSIGFGLGVRQRQSSGVETVDFGRVLTRARSSDSAKLNLDALCGGVAVLNEVYSAGHIAHLSDIERGKLLSQLVLDSKTDDSLQRNFADKGMLTAMHLSLVFDVIRPERLLLAGPLAMSSAYVDAFNRALESHIGQSGSLPDIELSTMTPTGASRWLALLSHVGLGNLDLISLKHRSAA